MITTPWFPKLEMNSSSGSFSLKARPSQEVTISLETNSDLKFEPQSSLTIAKPSSSANFMVKTKSPGMKVISYSAQTSDGTHFTEPNDSVIFVSPNTPPEKSVYGRLLLSTRELPLGCYEHASQEQSCNTKFVSTTPWTSNSTTGLVHVYGFDGVPVPLSVTGIDLKGVDLTRGKLIETTMLSTSNWTDGVMASIDSGQCSSVKLGQSDALELIDHSSLASSFLAVVSERTPGWFGIGISKDNDLFDINNIRVNLARNPLKTSPFSKFPLSASSSIAYQCPQIKSTIRVMSSEVLTLTDKGSCFAVDTCRSSALIHFAPSNRNDLKSLKIFKDMEDKGLRITLKSVGFFGNGETTKAKGVIWNGTDFMEREPFQYSIWLEGGMLWTMQIPQSSQVSINIQGEAFLCYNADLEEVSRFAV